MYRSYSTVFLGICLLLFPLFTCGQTYTISTFAGLGPALGDGAPAVNARFGTVSAVAMGPDGTLYIADAGCNQVRKVTFDGTVSLFAGSSVRGFGGDLGPRPPPC